VSKIDDVEHSIEVQSIRQSHFKPWYMIILGMFYFGQGYSLASLALLLPLYIKDELLVGSYSRSVAISAIIISPWYFKVLFGILSDNFPILGLGRRKPYLIIATIFSVYGWLTLGIHSKANLFFVLSGVSLAIGSAMADSVVDGQAVEITPKNYVARLQGVAWGSRGLGIGITGIVSSEIVHNFGWQSMFYLSSFFGIGISIIVLIIPQVKLSSVADSTSKIHQITHSFQMIFDQKEISNRLIFFFFSGIGLAVVPLLALIMEREFEYSIDTIGRGALAFALGSFLGATVYGIIIDNNETHFRVKLLVTSYLVTLISTLFFEFLHSLAMQFMLLFLIGITAGAFEGYQLKIIQESSPDRIEGTAFALFTGISNIGQFAIGGYIIIYLAETYHTTIFYPLQMSILVVIVAYTALFRIKFLNRIPDSN
jgi:MFS family permease